MSRNPELEAKRLAKSLKTKQLNAFKGDFSEQMDLKYKNTLASSLEINFADVCCDSYRKMIKEDNNWAHIRSLIAYVIIKDNNHDEANIKRPKDFGYDTETIKNITSDCTCFLIDQKQFKNKNHKEYKDISGNEELIRETELVIIDLKCKYFLRPFNELETINQTYCYFFKVYLDLYTNSDFLNSNYPEEYIININLFLDYQLNRNFKGRFRSFKIFLEKIKTEYSGARWIKNLDEWILDFESSYDAYFIDIIEKLPYITFEDIPKKPRGIIYKDDKLFTREEQSFLLLSFLTKVNPSLEENKRFLAQITSCITGKSVNTHYNDFGRIESLKINKAKLKKTYKEFLNSTDGL